MSHRNDPKRNVVNPATVVRDLVVMYMAQLATCKTVDDAHAIMTSANATFDVVLTPALVDELCKTRYHLSRCVEPQDISKIAEISSSISYTSYRIFLPQQEFEQFWQNDTMRKLGVILIRSDNYDQRTIGFKFVVRGAAPNQRSVTGGGRGQNRSGEGRGRSGRGSHRSVDSSRPRRPEVDRGISQQAEALLRLNSAEPPLETYEPEFVVDVIEVKNEDAKISWADSMDDTKSS
jgi:hypothetical protein